jgi:ribosomal protein S18 acetylase RimI-like enzyme
MEINENVSDCDATIISKLLEDYNNQYATDYNSKPLRFSVKSEGKIIGGLLALTFWNYLYIDTLILNTEFRGCGFGKKMLNRAEKIAIERNCTHACLNTHDFQSPEFYFKYGYKKVGNLPDLPSGFNRLLLYKRLI